VMQQQARTLVHGNLRDHATAGRCRTVSLLSLPLSQDAIALPKRLIDLDTRRIMSYTVRTSGSGP
jgi:hypothetical protein